ncbi:hypothetical protein HK102_006219, partial [Quaeritorhiza haematococci]
MVPPHISIGAASTPPPLTGQPPDPVEADLILAAEIGLVLLEQKNILEMKLAASEARKSELEVVVEELRKRWRYQREDEGRAIDFQREPTHFFDLRPQPNIGTDIRSDPIHDLNNKLYELEHTISELTDEIAKLSRLLSCSEREKITLREERERLLAQIEQAKMTEMEHSITKASYRREILSLKGVIAELKGRMEDWDTVVVEARSELNGHMAQSTSTDIERSKNDGGEIADDGMVQQLVEEINTLLARISDLERERDELRLFLDNARDAVEEERAERLLSHQVTCANLCCISRGNFAASMGQRWREPPSSPHSHHHLRRATSCSEITSPPTATTPLNDHITEREKRGALSASHPATTPSTPTSTAKPHNHLRLAIPVLSPPTEDTQEQHRPRHWDVPSANMLVLPRSSGVIRVSFNGSTQGARGTGDIPVPPSDMAVRGVSDVVSKDLGEPDQTTDDRPASKQDVDGNNVELEDVVPFSTWPFIGNRDPLARCHSRLTSVCSQSTHEMSVSNFTLPFNLAPSPSHTVETTSVPPTPTESYGTGSSYFSSEGTVNNNDGEGEEVFMDVEKPKESSGIDDACENGRQTVFKTGFSISAWMKLKSMIVKYKKAHNSRQMQAYTSTPNSSSVSISNHNRALTDHENNIEPTRSWNDPLPHRPQRKSSTTSETSLKSTLPSMLFKCVPIDEQQSAVVWDTNIVHVMIGSWLKKLPSSSGMLKGSAEDRFVSVSPVTKMVSWSRQSPLEIESVKIKTEKITSVKFITPNCEALLIPENAAFNHNNAATTPHQHTNTKENLIIFKTRQRDLIFKSADDTELRIWQQ